MSRCRAWHRGLTCNESHFSCATVLRVFAKSIQDQLLRRQQNLNLCSAPQELEKWVKAALQFPGRATSVLTLQVEWCKFYDVDYVEQDGHACVFGKQLFV